MINATSIRNNISNQYTPIVFDQTPANPTEEAVEIALEKYKSEALVLLDDFIDSEAKTSLIELVEYSISRKK